MRAQITNVSERRAGSELAVAATALDEEIEVVDALDFDPDGGELAIGDEVIAYTMADEDGDVLELATPLVDSYAVEEPVQVNPTSIERIASLQVDDEDEDLEAVVPHALYALLDVGVRAEGAGEMVEAGFRVDELVVENVIADEPHIGSGFLALSPQVVFTKTSAQAVADGNTEVIEWDEFVATDDFEVPGAGTVAKFKETGLYLFVLQGVWGPSDIGRREIGIIRLPGSVGDAELLGFDQLNDPPPATDTAQQVTVAAEIFEDDELEAYCFANAGSPINFKAKTSPSVATGGVEITSKMTIYRVGG